MSRSVLSALVISLGLHGAVLGWIAWDGWSPGKAPAGQILVLEVHVVSASGEIQTGSSSVGISRKRERVARVRSEEPGKKTEEPVLAEDSVSSHAVTAHQDRADDSIPDVKPIAVALSSHGVGSPIPEKSLDERLRAIRACIEERKAYPHSARREGIEGTTTLAFRIREGGGVEGLRVVRSAGSSLLDEASLEAVRRAAPLPLVEGEIRVSLVFQLRSF